MNLTNECKEYCENVLENYEYKEEGEIIEAYTKGNWYSFSGPVQGEYIFTDRKLMFRNFYGKPFAIYYSDIKEINKCNITFIIPFGIRVTAYDRNKKKEEKYILSMIKRNDWFTFLTSKAQVYK